jgi:hypothetical protein
MEIVHFTYCVFLLCVFIEILTYLFSIVVETIYHYFTQNHLSRNHGQMSQVFIILELFCFTNVEIVLQGLT